MAEFPVAEATPSVKATGKKVVVVLQQASLETVKTKRGYELLNCDEHVGYLKKAGRDPAQYRPDITHQLLLGEFYSGVDTCALCGGGATPPDRSAALLDSPLNKAGMLQVYVETINHILIEVSPHIRIPRTYKRFAGLMVQLLHKMKVRAADSAETLLKVIKNPVTSHLPIGAPIVGLEAGAPLVEAWDLPRAIAADFAAGKAGKATSKAPTTIDSPVVFVIGAMSHGDIDADYIQRTYSVSKFPLSAACAVSKLLNAFEHTWGVI